MAPPFEPSQTSPLIVFQRQIWSILGDDRIVEHHDSGNGVDAAILQLLHERGRVEQRCYRACILEKLDLSVVVDIAFFDVDHQSIELSAYR